MKASLNLSSSSDSEDDVQMRRFLAAADTTLLTNEMFQRCSATNKTPTELSQPTISQPQTAIPVKDTPKSQRYLAEEESHAGADLNLPAAVQRHISKKLGELIAQQVEFCVLPVAEVSPLKQKRPKSKLKLLREADCYVKPYEEFEYETRGPEQKPHFKRRNVDQEPELSIEERCLAATVDAAVVLNGGLMQGWAPRVARREKVFHYRMDAAGLLHAKESTNEFTQLRRKNGWNVGKIRHHVGSKCVVART